MQYRGHTRLSVALALSLGLVAAFTAPAGAATGNPGAASRAGEQSLHIWAYFDGDTPVSGGRVRVYAGGRQLRARGFAPGPVRTFPAGMALLRFTSLPSALRIVVSGGRAGGEPVQGSLRTKVRGVTDGDVVHVNPVTTVSHGLAHSEDGPGLRAARKLTERTLGIRPILDDHELYATDQWFEGDVFRRWAMEQGSVGAGARTLVQLIEQPGFDRRRFRPEDGGNPKGKARAAASGKAIAANVINGLLDAVGSAAAVTGPLGFVLGGALVVFKQLISLGLEDSGDKKDGDDQLSAQLRGLSAQVAQLQARIDTQFFQLQAKSTRERVTNIQATQDKYLDMLMWAGVVEDTKQTPEKRAAARTSLDNSTLQFLRGAQDLQNEERQLNQALTDEQTGTIKNPVGGPALIPAVRALVGNERFFTNESSEKIRGFFRYYEWAQTNLATVRTEFYLLGGECAKNRLEQAKPDPGQH
jgi:hypothetical protein